MASSKIGERGTNMSAVSEPRRWVLKHADTGLYFRGGPCASRWSKSLTRKVMHFGSTGEAIDEMSRRQFDADKVGPVPVRAKRPRAGPAADVIADTIRVLDQMRQRFASQVGTARLSHLPALALEWADIIEATLTDPPQPDDTDGWHLYAPERARGRAQQRMKEAAPPPEPTAPAIQCIYCGDIDGEQFRAAHHERCPCAPSPAPSDAALRSAVEAWQALSDEDRTHPLGRVRPCVCVGCEAALALLEAAARRPFTVLEVTSERNDWPASLDSGTLTGGYVAEAADRASRARVTAEIVAWLKKIGLHIEARVIERGEHIPKGREEERDG